MSKIKQKTDKNGFITNRKQKTNITDDAKEYYGSELDGVRDDYNNLPDNVRNNIKDIEINADRNNHIGLSSPVDGGDKITIYGMDYPEEVRDVFNHEVGHTVFRYNMDSPEEFSNIVKSSEPIHGDIDRIVNSQDFKNSDTLPQETFAELFAMNQAKKRGVDLENDYRYGDVNIDVFNKLSKFLNF